jgi:hypothetical protein
MLVGGNADSKREPVWKALRRQEITLKKRKTKV